MTTITDPNEIDISAIKQSLAVSPLIRFEFSHPYYTSELLQKVNELCEEFEGMIELRFYDHFRVGFDAEVLTWLPGVQNLVLQSLVTIRNVDFVGKIPSLRKLWFGVRTYNNPLFLHTINLEQMTELTIEGCEARNFDLAPLRSAQSLKKLFVEGHTKNIVSISHASNLEIIILRSIPKSIDLSFLNKIPKLKSVTLGFGGRTSFSEFHHDQLETLIVYRVQGLNAFGDLKRFPNLRKLTIEDQPKLLTVDLSGAHLEDVTLANCKNLSEICGIQSLNFLKHMRVYKSSLDIGPLIKMDWPASLKILALYTGSTKKDAAIRDELDLRGFTEFGSVNQ